MFERRLKILLMLLMVVSAALALRAAQIQIFARDYWRDRAVALTRRDEFVETERGSILDRNGRPLACDAPCVDACVLYPAIPDDPDPQWLASCAITNLKNRFGEKYGPSIHSPAWQTGKWKSVLDDETQRVQDDLNAMWRELAEVGGKSPDEIDQIRADIVQRVEMRKRYVWWHNYDDAMRKSDPGNSTSWYRRFLSDTAPDESSLDKFEVEVGEETQPHMILHNISPQVQARLARERDRFFCLVLTPSKYRQYPYGRVACNVLGYLQTARPQEIAEGADATDVQLQHRWSLDASRYWPQTNVDHYGIPTFRELRKYWPADLLGRTGIEALCENTLRGTRGKIVSIASTDADDRVVDRIDATPGMNVFTTIDVQLQQDIENAFVKTRAHRTDEGATDIRFNQHGAAVVIKVDTGEVLALVSNPGFDLNDLDAHYADYATDELNRPMIDRATETAMVPGSTVKPIVGSGSITDGTMRPTDRIQCKGVLYINGQPQAHGHCWIYNVCNENNLPISHGSPGAGDPFIGPDNMLTVTDGIRVSCNVVFETIALKMGIARLSDWFDRFGLGRRTGIGIEENPGMLYRPSAAAMKDAETKTWSMGIGEEVVAATPIQMANVAATLARGGVWMRPRLVADDQVGRAGNGPSASPDAVDLHLSPDALAAVQKGMREVCSLDGSGASILPQKIDRGPGDPPLADDPLLGMPLAGKTGSAQTGGFMTLVDHDAAGKPFIRQVHFGDPGTDGWYSRPLSAAADDPHPEYHLAHAWFIGYAPADHPQVAFCVMVEYGEAGGRVAGPIAHDLLVACVKHGYLHSK